MGFGHFFGSCCVSFLVAVQAAGMWGAEATLLEEFGARKIYEEAIVDGMYEQVRVRPNKALHKACRFLFTTAVLMSLALMALAPLYFLSRDVYEDSDDGERAGAIRRANRVAVHDGRGEGGMRAGRDDVRGEHATDRVVESHPLLGKRGRATQRDVHRLPHGDHRVLVRRQHRARLEPKRGTTRRRARGVCTTRQAEDEHI